MKNETKTQVKNRLKRVEGQIRGIQKMLDDDKYCIDIITQTSAVRKALSAAEDLILENHLSEHVIHQIRHGEEKKAVREILSVYKVSHKK